jgi:Ca-activated chloride channel homolog
LSSSGPAGHACLGHPPRRARVFVTAALTLAAGVLPAGAQAFKEEDEVSAVLVPVTVRDAKGRLVGDLERKAFHLYLDGLQFPIKSFWRENDLPLSLAFLLDTSGSMGHRRLGKASDAILEFVRQFRPGDEACLITFGAGEVKRRLPFGTDPRLLSRILESLSGFGTTALYDVLTVTPKVMDGAKNVRRAILLFTDGVDTASQFTPDDALNVLESLSDPLYTFGIEPPPPEAGKASYEELLRRFAEASGGRYIRVDDLAALPQAARGLRRELTQRYIIAFEPSGVGMEKQRKISVKVDGEYQVVTRQSYRGTLP